MKYPLATIWLSMSALMLTVLNEAHAQVQMDDGGPCYTWQGGNFSAGAFTKCPQQWVIAKAPPRVVATPVAQPMVAPSPIMMPMSCPPVQPKKPIVKKKRPPPVKC